MRFFIPALAALTLLSLTAVRADDVQTHMQKAQAAATAKDWDGAIVELDAAIALDQTNIQAHTGRAMMLVQKQNFKDAIPEVSRVIELDPKNINAYKMRSELYKKTGEQAKSKEDFITFMRLSPDDSAQLEAAAKAASAKEDWPNAVNLWDLVSQVHPNDAHPLYERGMALKGSYYTVFMNASGTATFQDVMDKLKADTKASFDGAIKADPKFVPAYLAQDDLVAMNQGLKVLPDNAELLVGRADMSMRLITSESMTPSADTIKAAIDDYNHALKSDPKSASAYMGRAHAYQSDTKYDLALADTTRALALKPNDFDILVLRGELYDDKNDYANEIAEDERALLLKPDNTDLLLRHYKALTHLPDKARAFAAINKLIDSNPSTVIYRQARAELYFEQKDYPHASADVDKVLAVEPDNKDATALRDKIVAAQK